MLTRLKCTERWHLPMFYDTKNYTHKCRCELFFKQNSQKSRHPFKKGNYQTIFILDKLNYLYNKLLLLGVSTRYLKYSVNLISFQIPSHTHSTYISISTKRISIVLNKVYLITISYDFYFSIIILHF